MPLTWKWFSDESPGDTQEAMSWAELEYASRRDHDDAGLAAKARAEIRRREALERIAYDRMLSDRDAKNKHFQGNLQERREAFESELQKRREDFESEMLDRQIAASHFTADRQLTIAKRAVVTASISAAAAVALAVLALIQFLAS